MDLQHALNLNNCNVNLPKYLDYTEVEPRHFDLNKNFSERTFDINPNTLKYKGNSSISGPQATKAMYTDLVPTWNPPNQPSGLPPQALPVYMGQSNVSNQSYFPRPIEVVTPQAPMTQSFMLMKHAQEIETLSEQGDPNAMSLERLKQKQARELQLNLQNQKQLTSNIGGMDALNPAQYAHVSSIKTVNQTCAYNAQGEAVHNQETLYKDRANKYKMLKDMSPEMLNKMYGRQSDQSVLPQTKNNALGDIYEQTSCYKVPTKIEQKSHDQLRAQLNTRQKDILGQKQQLGIQSYYDGLQGNQLDDVFKPI